MHLAITSTKLSLVYRHASETKETTISNKRNIVKIISWKQTSWLFTKRDQGFELGTTEKQMPPSTGWRP